MAVLEHAIQKKMEVKRNVSKQTLWGLAAACFIGAIAFVVSSVRSGIDGAGELGSLVTAAFVIVAFAFVFLALGVDTKKLQFLFLGVGLVIMGLAGLVLIFTQLNLGGVFLLLFGALGVFVIYKGLVAPEKFVKSDEENQFLRYLVVEEVIYINGSDKTVVIMKTNGDPLGLGRVYYETENAGMFHPNAKFMYDMRLFENGDRKIERINGYAAVNISYFKETDFRKFNAFMDKLFNLMQQQGMV